MAIASYSCPACGQVLTADRPLWRCECGSHLNLSRGRGLTRGEIGFGEASLWRYASAVEIPLLLLLKDRLRPEFLCRMSVRSFLPVCAFSVS